jgi:undecaprenyl-diphosphatase
MDIYFFQLINGISGHFAWLDSFMIVTAQYSPVFLALVLALLYLSFREKSQRAALLAGISAFLALGIGQVIGWIVNRPRPYSLATHVLIGRTVDSSFPSDHATLAFAVALLLWYYHKKLSLSLLALALMLSFARVYVGVHYPTDVLGGAILGSGVGLVVGKLSLRSPWKDWLKAFLSYLSRWRLAAGQSR